MIQQKRWEGLLSNACTAFGRLTPKADYDSILSDWRKMGIRIGAVTSDVRVSTIYCLRKMNLLNYFDEIISADDVAAVKPAPDAALLFCSRQRVLPSETAMIGDSDNDMLFAKQSGLCGILFRENIDIPLPEGAFMAVNHIQDIRKEFYQ